MEGANLIGHRDNTVRVQVQVREIVKIADLDWNIRQLVGGKMKNLQSFTCPKRSGPRFYLVKQTYKVSSSLRSNILFY